MFFLLFKFLNIFLIVQFEKKKKKKKSLLFTLCDGGKNGEKEKCFRKLSYLEKRKNELAFQETHFWNNTS